MDKLTINIIKKEFIGETQGHMEMIPNNPRLFSLLEAYEESVHGFNKANLFEDFIIDLADSIKRERANNG